MIQKKSKSIQHLYGDRSLSFNDLLMIFEKAHAGKLSEICTDIVEKTDGQNLSATYKNGVAEIAVGNGKVIEDIDERYNDHPSIRDSFKRVQVLLQASFNSVKDVDYYFDNGRVWVNMEVINPNTRNVIHYSDELILQFHNFVSYTDNNIRMEWVDDLQSLVNSIDSDAIIIGRNSVIFSETRLTENMKVLGKFRHDIGRLMYEFNLTSRNTIGDYFKHGFEKFIKENLPFISREERAHLINRWGGYDKSFRINGKYINKRYLEKIKDLDDVAWNHSQDLKNKLKEIILFSGAHLMKLIANPVCVDSSKSRDVVMAEFQKFKSSYRHILDESMFAQIENYFRIINNIGFINYVPVEGIVFLYKGNQYKITNGIFTYLNQLLNAAKYKRQRLL